MERGGYDKSFAGAIVAASCVIAPERGCGP
jgi:TRAP-type C4-dicarboxylate transport system permease large subunit